MLLTIYGYASDCERTGPLANRIARNRDKSEDLPESNKYYY